MGCIGSNVGVLNNKTGEFDREKIKEHGGAANITEEMKEAINNCVKTSESKDYCDSAFNLYKCFYDKVNP